MLEEVVWALFLSVAPPWNSPLPLRLASCSHEKRKIRIGFCFSAESAEVVAFFSLPVVLVVMLVMQQDTRAEKVVFFLYNWIFLRRAQEAVIVFVCGSANSFTRLQMNLLTPVVLYFTKVCYCCFSFFFFLPEWLKHSGELSITVPPPFPRSRRQANKQTKVGQHY